MPGSRLCLAFPKLGKTDIDDFKTVQIVEAMEDETGLERYMHCPEGSGYVVDEGYIPEEEILAGLPEESIATGLTG